MMKVKHYSVVGLIVLGIVLVPLLRPAQSPGHGGAGGLGEPVLALDTLAFQQTSALPGDDPGEKLKGKAKGLAAAICETAAVARGDDLGVFTAQQKDKLQRECEWSTEWAEETPAEEFKAMGLKRKTQCYVLEIIDDGIGDDEQPCTQQEMKKNGCVEAPEDAIGDDDGVCELLPHGQGKPVWEPCLETCALDAVEADDENFNDTTWKAMEYSLDEATGTLGEINTTVAARMAVLREVRATSSALSEEVTTGACQNLLTVDVGDATGFPPSPPPQEIYTERPADYFDLHDDLSNAWLTKWVAEVCTDVSGQDWGGFNFLAVCTAAHTAEWVLGTMYEEAELLDDAITGGRLDNALVCLEHLGDKLDGMDQKLDYLIYLMNLPPGQRPEFPKPPEVPAPTGSLPMTGTLPVSSTTDSPSGKSKP